MVDSAERGLLSGDDVAIGTGLSTAAVSLHMLAKVVGAHEAVVTHGTNKLLLAGVRAKVARQLVGARERLAAGLPLAHVGPLARVHAYVRLEVRTLEVALVAVDVGTRVVPEFARRLGGGRHERCGRAGRGRMLTRLADKRAAVERRLRRCEVAACAVNSRRIDLEVFTHRTVGGIVVKFVLWVSGCLVPQCVQELWQRDEAAVVHFDQHTRLERILWPDRRRFHSFILQI